MAKIFTVTSSRKAGWDIHGKDCTHVKKDFAIEVKATFVASDPKTIITAWIDEEMIEMGWTENDIRIMGCTENAPEFMEGEMATAVQLS